MHRSVRVGRLHSVKVLVVPSRHDVGSVPAADQADYDGHSEEGYGIGSQLAISESVWDHLQMKATVDEYLYWCV